MIGILRVRFYISLVPHQQALVDTGIDMTSAKTQLPLQCTQDLQPENFTVMCNARLPLSPISL